MQLKSYSKISLVSIGNIFNAVLGLAFLTAIARTLPLDQFGRYALLTILLVAIARIIDFGSNSLYVAQSIRNDKISKDAFISLKIVLFLITIPISIAILFILGLFEKTLVITFLFGLFAYGINFTLFAFFQKIEQFHFAVGLNTLPALIKGLVAIMIFLKLFTLTLNQAFLVFAVSMISSFLLSYYLPSELKNFRFTKSGIPKLLKQSYPAGIALTLNNSWPALSNSIAKFTKAFSGVGIFSVAEKIAGIFTLISISIFTVVLPKNARLRKGNKKYDLKETVLLSLGILLLAAMAISVSKLIVVTIFGYDFSGSVKLLNILILASALHAIHSFSENFFFVENKTPIILTITLTRLSVFIVFALALVPTKALIGIAYAGLASESAALLVTVLAINTLRKKRFIN